MIKVNGNEIEIEGSLEDLIIEASNILHIVAKTIESNFRKKYQGNQDQIPTYDDILKLIFLRTIKYGKIGISSNIIAPEIKENFFFNLEELKNAKKNSEDMIIFEFLKFSNSTFVDFQEDDFIIDPRLKDLYE
jgi:hypothetical protein